ncbi:putative membrane-associated zinc metalloprotease [Methylocaldum marinum]|uniref:Zinc metalloprotease n=1 Tax=Methylocaldum marinum TaxID=1432792 RepID=A0A250KSG6_9GAMM|nr:RIP metalloprotease RseP [Methylocaldum marinum]BBA34605.1 putative membrane-associated zinc metalloprotease [Methylocaldum marinum]
MFSLLHTLFYFLIALTILIAFHEFGHFWAARKLGVKVIRFSLGFGKILWRHQRTRDSTEFTVAALPLGGYVKMVDEREGSVAPADLPFAFNRQPLIRRVAIVFAGPFFNLVLAILIYWVVFMIGETGMRPVLGPVASGSLAGQVGFAEGDEIMAVAGEETPTWNQAMGELLEQIMEGDAISVDVKTKDGAHLQRTLLVPEEIAQQPSLLYQHLGFRPWEPLLPPVIDRIESGGAAEKAGLQAGDLLVHVDGNPIKTWREWVDIVRANPDRSLEVVVDRGGQHFSLSITPVPVESEEGRIGRIGAAVQIPEHLVDEMQVEYRLGVFSAFAAAIEKTGDYSVLTFKMIGRMLVGKAGIENLSGPISIAQYAGKSASIGLSQFLKFLAIVSVSLAVLNLLPIPVLDGGHLMFYLIEAVKGSPVSDRTQAFFQQIGLFILLSLMSLAFILDIERLLT